MKRQDRAPDVPATVDDTSHSQQRADSAKAAHVGGAILSDPADGVARTIFVEAASQSRADAAGELIDNRALSLLRQINFAVAQIVDRQQLFIEACRILVIEGGARIVSIAALEAGTSEGAIVASCGAPPGFLDQGQVTTRDDLAMSTLPASRALRERRPIICDDLSQGGMPHSRQQRWLDQGIGAAAAFPILLGERAIGVLEVLASRPGFFDAQMHQSLLDFASVLALGAERIETRHELHRLQHYDALTDLPRTALFDEQVNRTLRLAATRDAPVAMILIGVEFDGQQDNVANRDREERSKNIALRTMAGRLREAIHDPQLLALENATTFAIAVPDMKDEAELSSFVQQLIFDLVAQPVIAGGAAIQLLAHAGVARYPDDGTDASRLRASALTSLTLARQTNRRLIFSATRPDATASDQQRLVARLQQAFNRQEFVLHYQPKISSRDGRVVGLEALIRWNDPDVGMIPPAMFIGAMETSGLICQVGEWALCQALADHWRWQFNGLHPPRVAVKVSAAQMTSSDIVAVVRGAIAAANTQPGALEIEVSEDVVMQDVQTQVHALQKIRQLGVSIAVDNFGTGHTSMRDLPALPVDSLKIDRSFVASMVHDDDSLRTVAAIISVAHALDLQVVAEGVETDEQARLLKIMRCDEQRGYLISRPLPDAACAELLSQHHDRRATGSSTADRVQ